MRRFLCLVAVLVAGLFIAAPAAAQDSTPAASPAACPALSRDETADVAQRYLNVWNTRDLTELDAVADPGVVHHWGQGVDTQGVDDLKASIEAFFTAFPDMVMTLDDTIVEGDTVVIRWTLTGTQTGPFFQTEPTGVTAEWTGVNIYRVECGQVVESWSEADGVGLRQQLNPQDVYATPEG
jgi:predicted ester cyclase